MSLARADRLYQVRALVEKYGDQPLVSWFTEGVDRFTRGEIPTLCVALELRGRGQNSITSDIARSERNRHLEKVYALCAGDIARMVQEVNRFRCGKWRWCREDEDPPEGFNGLQAELFRAFQVGERYSLPVPTSEKQLLRVVDLV